MLFPSYVIFYDRKAIFHSTPCVYFHHTLTVENHYLVFMLAFVKQTVKSYIEVTKISESSLLIHKNWFIITHCIGESSTLTDLSTVSEGKAKSGIIIELWRKGEFKMTEGGGSFKLGNRK